MFTYCHHQNDFGSRICLFGFVAVVVAVVAAAVGAVVVVVAFFSLFFSCCCLRSCRSKYYVSTITYLLVCLFFYTST